jgi:hypothetical protein
LLELLELLGLLVVAIIVVIGVIGIIGVICDMLILFVMCCESDAHDWVVIVVLGLGILG